MRTETRIEAIDLNEAANTAFQVVVIAMIGFVSLTETIAFLARAAI